MDNNSPNPPLPPNDADATDAIPSRRPSKAAVFIAMAAVAVAILLVMLAPGGGAGDTAAPVTNTTRGNPPVARNSPE
jgi:hypothetical protein